MAAPTSLQRFARRAILTRAKSATDLIALVPVTNIAPDGEVSWPKVLVESPRTLRIRAACVRGATVSFDVHVFAGPRVVAGVTQETGYDHASRIGAEIETLFSENRLVLENGSSCRTRISDSQMLRDEEPDAWHWFGQLNCRVLAE